MLRTLAPLIGALGVTVDTLLHALDLANMSLDGPMYFWPISAALVLGTVLTVSRLIRSPHKITFGLRGLFVAIPASWLAILLLGALFAVERPSAQTPQTQEIPGYILATTAIASLCLSVSFTIAARKQIIPSIVLLLAGVWFGFWFFFVAAMSVSGVWL